MYEMGPLVNSSYFELEVALYYEYAYPHCTVYSKYTSSKPYKMGNFTCDILIEDKRTKEKILNIEVHGCVTKGCPDYMNCPELRGKIFDINTPNYLKRTPREYQIERERRDRFLRRAGVRNLEHMWQCRWQRLVSGDLTDMHDRAERDLALDIRDYLSSSAYSRPKERLSARTSVRGGIYFNVV
jgi:hypothetical protein